MQQKLTITLKDANKIFAKKYAKKHNTSISELVNEHFELLRKIDDSLKKEKLVPLVKQFSGVVKSGKRNALNDLFHDYNKTR